MKVWQMMSFDAGKVFDTKLKWRLFSITLSIALAVLTLVVVFWVMLELIRLMIRVGTMMEAHNGAQIHASSFYAFSGGILVFWLIFHYFSATSMCAFRAKLAVLSDVYSHRLYRSPPVAFGSL
jgi:hypothetical protein